MLPLSISLRFKAIVIIALLMVCIAISTFAQVAVPYEQKFPVTGMPSGWTTQNSGITSTIWTVDYGSGAGGGTCEAKASPVGQNGISRLILPPFYTTGLSELRLSFRQRINSYQIIGLIFKVQSSTDGINWTNEDFLYSSIQESVIASYQSFMIKNNLGNVTYLAFVMEGLHSEFINWDIDDVYVGEYTAQANCPGFQKPQYNQINVPLIGSITWRTGSYSLGNTFFFGTDNPPTNIVNGVDMGLKQQYDYAPLLPNTQYRYKVLTYNNNGVKPFCSNFIFTTTPALPLPYADSFATNYYPTAWAQQSSGLSDKPPAWNIGYGHKAGGTSYEMKCEWKMTSGLNRFISPPINTSGLTEINFRMDHYIKSLTAGLSFKIQTSADGVNWTDEKIWSSATGTFGPELSSMMLQHNLGNYTFISFTIEGDFTAFEGWYIDNITITGSTGVPGCCTQVFPVDSATDIHPAYDLNWTQVPGASGYKLYLGTNNPPTNVYDGLDVGNIHKTDFTSLAPGQTYYWSVVPYNQNGQALGCPVKLFTTQTAESIPFAEDFNSSVIPQTWLSNWKGHVESSVWSMYSILGPLAPYAIKADGAYENYRGITRMILPPLDTGGAYNLNLAFQYYFISNDSGLIIKIQSSSDGRTWNDADWIKTSEENDNVNYRRKAQVLVPANINGPTYIAFVIEGNHNSLQSWIIDSVRVQAVFTDPGCISTPNPPHLATDVALNSTLLWRKNTNALGYRLYLGTDNPPTNIISGLDLGSDTAWHEMVFSQWNQYYWKVVPYNNAGPAINCPIMSFTTGGPLPLPFTESFNSTVLPANWSVEQYGSKIIWTHQFQNTSNGPIGYERARYISNYFFNNGTSRLVSPALNTTGLTGITLNFKHTFQGYDYGICIKIQTSSDGLNWSDESWFHRGGSDGYLDNDTVTVSLGQNLGNVTFIAFTLEGGLSNFYQWLIDDVVVTAGSAIPPCSNYVYPPDNLNDVAENVKLSWEMNPLATSYNLYLGTDNPPTNLIYNLSTGVSNEYLTSNLEPNTQYYWQIIPQSSAGSPSNCSVQSFTVTSAKNLPYTENFNEMYFPAGWRQEHSGGIMEDIWDVADTNRAGGQAPEMLAHWFYGYGTTRLITPPLNTTNYEYITLNFKHLYQQYYYDAIMYVQSSADGINWTDERTLFEAGSNMNYSSPVSIKIIHNLGTKTYLSFTVVGNHVAILNWHIDNVTISPPIITEYPEVFTISAPDFYCQGSSGVPITLSGSQLNAEYSLYKSGVLVGSPVAGTGNPLIWNDQLASTYLIVSKYNNTYIMMSGGKQISNVANPLPNAGVDVSINEGQAAQLECAVSSGAAPYSFSWSPPTGLSDPAIANPIASPSVTTSYIVSVTDANTCSNSDTIVVTVMPGGIAIQGELLYLNDSPLSNCQVELVKDGVVVQTITTDITGAFTFSNVEPGDYTFNVTVNKDWGGGNAVDALLIMQHFVGLMQLTGLPLLAADLLSLGAINSIDALTVMRRFVGLITSFTVPDWIVENPTVTVSTNNVNVQIKAICAGDVNTSYVPSL
ncbi:MAG: hypothetical protein AB9842_02230 [Bacteroidales bacterium]